MEQETYFQIYRLERDHWWFAARRKIIFSLIKSVLDKKVARALDVGCGTGFNAKILSSFSENVIGLEPSKTAIALAKEVNPNLQIIEKDFLKLDNQKSFGLITLFDVLEHIEDDVSTLKKIEQLLERGGIAVLTVPAFPWLWSQHDMFHHHYRRYTVKNLREKIANHTQLKIERMSFFNFLLFLPLLIMRFSARLLPKRNGSDLFALPPFINKVLTKIFSLEASLLSKVNLPFGSSIICIVRKP